MDPRNATSLVESFLREWPEASFAQTSHCIVCWWSTSVVLNGDS